MFRCVVVISLLCCKVLCVVVLTCVVLCCAVMSSVVRCVAFCCFVLWCIADRNLFYFHSFIFFVVCCVVLSKVLVCSRRVGFGVGVDCGDFLLYSCVVLRCLVFLVVAFDIW